MEMTINKEFPPMRKPLAGWRYFHCDDCGYKWHEASRDCKSPSTETCPECYMAVWAYKSVVDESLKTDGSGNLI